MCVYSKKLEVLVHREAVKTVNDEASGMFHG